MKIQELTVKQKKWTHPLPVAVLCIILALTGVQTLAAGPTLKTITVDGDPTDWGPVLTNPLQVTNDGEFSPACDVAPLDLDCTTNTTIKGRDLDSFAWTFDSTNIYMYITRYGSSANTQTYYFYCDSNQDQLMGTGEKVLQVTLNGQNRSTEAWVNTYLQDETSIPGPDEMVCYGTDPGACPVLDMADGFTIRGTLPSRVSLYGPLVGGFLDGTGFECYIPWASLGVSAGTPIFFHVASSNNTNPSTVPAQIDDNLGGPDGGIGRFAYYLGDIYDDESSTVAPGTNPVATYDHTIQNVGSFDDRYEIDAASSLGLEVNLYYWDTVNLNWVLAATDDEGDGTWDWITTDVLIDTDGNGVADSDPDFDNDGIPETSWLAAGAFPAPGDTFPIRITLIDNSAGGYEDVLDTTVVTITSMLANYTVTDSVTDLTAIGNVLLQPAFQYGTAIPGNTIDYNLTLTNYTLADTFDLTVSSTQGYRVDIYLSDGVTLVATDLTGDGTWDTITPGYDTNGDGNPDFGETALGGTQDLVIRVDTDRSPDPQDPVGTVDVVTVTVQGNTYGESTSATLTTTLRDCITLTPSYTVASGTNKYSGDNRSVFYSHTLINSWPVDADPGSGTGVTLSAVSSPAWTVRFYTDPNGDGNPSDGSPITGPVFVAANGSPAFNFVVEVVIPDLSTFPTTNSTAVTASTPLDAACTATATDEVRVSYLSTYSDSNRTISQSFFARCDTVYVLGSSLTPNTTTTYSIRYYDESPWVDPPVYTQAVPTDGNGVALSQYTFGSADTLGPWTIRLMNGTTQEDSIGIILDPANTPSTIDPLETNRGSYSETGQNLVIEATFNNTSDGATYYNTIHRYVITDYAGTVYLQTNGTFTTPYTAGTDFSRITSPHDLAAGDSETQTLSFTAVDFSVAGGGAGPGVYTILVQWRGTCANSIATATKYFPVGTTLASYSDAAYTVPEDIFAVTGDTVYLDGDYYLYSTSYTVAYYGPDGALVATQSVTSDGSGNLSWSTATSSLGIVGLWHAVVYEASITPPADYNDGDKLATSSDTFYLAPDSDNDGIIDPDDPDDDNDGILDTVEAGGLDPSADDDGDLIPNYLDPDYPGFTDTNGDGVNDNLDTDMDGTPDHLDLDADGDGVWDLIEGNDADHDGFNDDATVLDANDDGRIDPADFVDTNSDGLDDRYDPALGGTAAAVQDTDSDGAPDFQDVDDDDDNVPTSGEDVNGDSDWSNDDTDGDGIPNYLDPDDDGDGVPTADEDIDTDGDPTNDDSDGDGTPNYLDDDDDGDGIPSADEDPNGNGDPTDDDSDGDGLPDYLDIDTDGDGIPDAVEGSGDADGDGIPNYRDTDSDGDGVPDSIEGHDSDQDGVADTTPAGSDSDGDGLDDAYDTVDGVGPGNATGSNAPLQDTDTNGTDDYLDDDDDGDGVLTEDEDYNGDGDWSNDDCDGDGTPDYLDPDLCLPNLLRNDIIANLSSYDLATIFTKTYPKPSTIPSLDQFGADVIPGLGEGIKQEDNGSSDDDDFYAMNLTSPFTDSDPSVLTDNTRPLVFYELDADVTIYVTKSGGSIQVSW